MIRNKTIKKSGYHKTIIDCIEVKQLSWYGHVQGTTAEKSNEIDRKEKEKKSWIGGIKKLMSTRGLFYKDCNNRDNWLFFSIFSHENCIFLQLTFSHFFTLHKHLQFLLFFNNIKHIKSKLLDGLKSTLFCPLSNRFSLKRNFSEQQHTMILLESKKISVF